MLKKYKEYHAEKSALERKEALASVHTTLELIRICARNSSNFDEFTELLDAAIEKIEAKMEE